MQTGVFAAATALLLEADPVNKCDGVARLAAAVRAGRAGWDDNTPVPAVEAAGRPQRPRLVPAADVPRRRLGSHGGRLALIHAIAHIEFNAINLALDAVCRFRSMPKDYYRDWIGVAADEARHFTMLARRMVALGAAYGDYPAHDGLWEMAIKTADSCLVRMALVPRVLEARGLDVTPGMIARLSAAGDEPSAALLEIILAEEIAHVATGTRWFRHCCEQQGLDPEAAFLHLIDTRFSGSIRGPFNLPARLEAGFTAGEMAGLGRTIDGAALGSAEK